MCSVNDGIRFDHLNIIELKANFGSFGWNESIGRIEKALVVGTHMTELF